MQVTTVVESDVHIAAVEGRIDSHTVPELHSFLNAIVAAGGNKLVADLAGVDFMSSASLRMMLDVVRQVRGKGGDLRLAAVREPVARIFDLTGFAGILRMFPDAASAAASYGV